MLFELSEKRQIARAFSRMADVYDEQAHFQRQVGGKLLTMLNNTYSFRNLMHKTVLDIGAGSGVCSQKMQQSGASVIALDLSEGMLKYIAKQARAGFCLLADAETLPLADNSVDICFSSLAVQWCNLSEAVEEMRRVTKKGGVVAVATVAYGSLQQLENAWQTVDKDIHINRFLNMVEIRSVFSNFPRVKVFAETYTQTFDCVRELVCSLKHIGANYVASRNHKGLTGKHRWQCFQKAYEQYRRADGLLPLDYHIVYVLADMD